MKAPDDTPCSPELDWANGLPCSRQFDDVYFSRHNGLDETRHVFLQGNKLKERFSQLKPYECFTIAETGFGTGLNFLAAWQLWQQCAPKTGKLHFISVEKYPLSISQLARAWALWPELAALSKILIERYPSPVEQPVNRLYFEQGNVRLTLLIGDVKNAFEAIDPSLSDTNSDTSLHAHMGYGERKVGIDAWFLDGFSPSKNPEMWQPTLYQTMAKLSSYAKGASTLSTFTAAGHVRRGLNAAGFCVSKVPGFGRKREMVTGELSFCTLDNTDHYNVDNFDIRPDHEAENNTQRARSNERRKQVKHYWHTQRCKYQYKYQYQQQPQHQQEYLEPIAVIGAGLAGCHTAYALAKRGYTVHVFDSATEIAAGASGNPQGIVYSRFSHQQDILATFNLAALRYADAFYREGFYERAGAQTGVLHLSQTDKLSSNHAKIAAHHHNESNLKTASLLNTQEASQRTGQPLETGGLISELGGWLRPKVLCEQLIDHSNIQVFTEHNLTHYEYDADLGWELSFEKQSARRYSKVVIANAFAAKQLPFLEELPTKAIRGQVTSVTLPIDHPCAIQTVSTPICGEGYIAPPYLNEGCAQYTFGATFDLKSQSQAVSAEDNYKNWDMVQALLSRDASKALGEVSIAEHFVGRASFRCATSDYLPIVGPVATPENKQRFNGYSANRFAQINQCGAVYEGLYVNVGHGSRGLTYTPIAAELIASLIAGEPLPVSSHLYQNLHSGRFTIRSLMRNRPLS